MPHDPAPRRWAKNRDNELFACCLEPNPTRRWCFEGRHTVDEEVATYRLDAQHTILYDADSEDAVSGDYDSEEDDMEDDRSLDGDAEELAVLRSENRMLKEGPAFRLLVLAMTSGTFTSWSLTVATAGFGGHCWWFPRDPSRADLRGVCDISGAIGKMCFAQWKVG
ncbi:hypothetical protein HKX48_003163 [Thoreauomyces humboldtii]|nr:hypothetical protein HKX48_003163 [Thoreauomyces humboldtii]